MNAPAAVSTELIATCWTSAGDVTPMAATEHGPHDVLERVRAVAATGWSGIGIGYHEPPTQVTNPKVRTTAVPSL